MCNFLLRPDQAYDLVAGSSTLVLSKFVGPMEALAWMPTLATSLGGRSLKGGVRQSAGMDGWLAGWMHARTYAYLHTTATSCHPTNVMDEHAYLLARPPALCCVIRYCTTTASLTTRA